VSGWLIWCQALSWRIPAGERSALVSLLPQEPWLISATVWVAAHHVLLSQQLVPPLRCYMTGLCSHAHRKTLRHELQKRTHLEALKRSRCIVAASRSGVALRDRGRGRRRPGVPPALLRPVAGGLPTALRGDSAANGLATPAAWRAASSAASASGCGW
jgi:hypothetical protein